MLLDQLRVFHQRKGYCDGFVPPAFQNLFVLDTCQRTLWVGCASKDDGIPMLCGGEIFKGEEAYRFLLRVASGLESVIVGETDVFGQIKSAWRIFEESESDLIQELRPWMQRVFEDTKQIRKTYLQNLGGNSYGTLVRKWIRSSGTESRMIKILLVGAGQIAHSIAPFLPQAEIWLSNRNEFRLKEFHQKKLPHSKLALSTEDQMIAWQEATHVIVCTPFDAEMDLQKMGWFLSGGSLERHILHLGGNDQEKGEFWHKASTFTSLSDLYELQQRVAHYRSSQMSQADQACLAFAQQRALYPLKTSVIGTPHRFPPVADEVFSFAY